MKVLARAERPIKFVPLGKEEAMFFTFLSRCEMIGCESEVE